MVDVNRSSMPTSSSSSTYVNNTFSSFSIKNFVNKHLLLLTLIPLSFFLVIFLFSHGSFDDQLTRLSFYRSNSCSTGDQINNPPPSDEFATKVMVKSNLSLVTGSKFVNNDSFLTPKICITSTTSAGLEDILAWIFYHKIVGVSNFFLFVEGKAATPNVVKILDSIPGVKAIPRTRELEEQQANSRIWNETWLAGAFHKPCNAALFVKQTFNMEMAIVMAREAGMEWILHIDTDELLHPSGTQGYSIRELLANVSSNVDGVVFLNYEAAVEKDNIKQPFTEVSLFKKNLADIPSNYSLLNVKLLKRAMHNNSHFFLTYANGKSAARIQDHLRPNGAHRWNNYVKDHKEIQMKEAIVLHYTYTRFSDLTSRRDRCNCKPTEEDVKRCFYLKFDRSAFIIASTKPQDEMLQWYQEHVVWRDEKLKLKLLKYGIATRIYTPMVIIRQLRDSNYFASIMASANVNQSSVPQSLSNMLKDNLTERKDKIGGHNDSRTSSPMSSLDIKN